MSAETLIGRLATGIGQGFEPLDTSGYVLEPPKLRQCLRRGSQVRGGDPVVHRHQCRLVLPLTSKAVGPNLDHRRDSVSVGYLERGGHAQRLACPRLERFRL